VSVLNAVPERQRLQAVLMNRDGMGWAVGTGGLLDGEITARRSAFIDEQAARAAAVDLADALDLIAVRS
jgi:hypothetical protein